LNELENDLELVLADIYSRTNWRKINPSGSAYDFFNNKIKVAANESNIKKFIEVLTRKMGQQSISVNPEVIDNLENNKSSVLEKLREETVYWGLRAAAKAKEIKEIRKAKKENKA